MGKKTWQARSLAVRGTPSAAASLVEVMVASIVLLVGVLGAFTYFVYSRSSLNVEAHRRIAAEIAHSRLEELRAVSFGSLPSCGEQNQAVPIEALPGYRDTLVEDVDENSDGTVDYRKVTVKVRWVEGSRSREVSLVTFRSAER
jgi:Tfp pilus assembly protein PilV